MALEFNLIGLDASVERRYVWVGDDAVDREKSDVGRWIESGQGLEHDASKATVFVCRALTPTVLSIVRGYGSMGITTVPTTVPTDLTEQWVRNYPAVLRAAVAYGVKAIENGVFEQTSDSGGLRLSERLLDYLDKREVRLKHGDETVRVHLLSHLGRLIIGDSRGGDAEGKA